MTPLSGQPLAVPKWLLVDPMLLARGVHLIGEGLLGSGDAFGKHDRGIVARQGDDALQQILDADLLIRARNMVDPAAGPCHFCQVSGRTVHIFSSDSWPLSISSNATSVVIILAIDAGGIRASAFLA